MNFCRAVLLSLVLPLAALQASAAPVQQSPSIQPFSGVVLDASGAAITGAAVVVHSASGLTQIFQTDAEGWFVVPRTDTGSITVTISAQGFEPAAVAIASTEHDARIILQPSTVRESVTVHAVSGDAVITTGMKAPTPARDVPQAVSVVTKEQIRDLSMQGISDVVRYVPGVGIAQGESNRDAPVMRGATTSGDFFVDGIRDDAQYFRDLYNVQRVEVLKGPNAMAFGRGGVGGVINRVSKQAEWARVRELSLQAGAWANRRVTADIGDRLNGHAAFRVTGVFEDSGSYRQGAGIERQGITPSLAVTIGEHTMLQASAEYFHDWRTADRGIPSLNGRPLPTDASRFFGNADLSHAETTVNLASFGITRLFGSGIELRNRTQGASYDKFYQNVFPGAVNAAASTVAVSAYNHGTDRRNVFNQSDVLLSVRTGRVGHRLVTGVELGRQSSGNRRNTGFFTSISPSTTVVNVPLADPVTTSPITFQPSATDADGATVATVAAVYVQDHMHVSKHVELLAGLRYDRFHVDATNNRTADRFESNDNLLSPRLGLVYKPREPVSLYSSFTVAYQPRAGEQLTSLTLNNRALEPETFQNIEAGIKWDVLRLSVTAAAYRLVRRNVAITSPDDPGVMLLVDGQRMKGLELGVTGAVTTRWNVMGAYAYQQGRITTTQSATIRAGASLGQVPAHTFSLWNRYNVTKRVGAGLGLIRRGDMFVAADNAVGLPAFTRADGALFVTLGRQVRAQVNVENLFNTEYYASANSNNNITPGSPRAVRVTVTAGF